MKRSRRANYRDLSCRAYADCVGCNVDSGLKNLSGYSGFLFQPQKSTYSHIKVQAKKNETSVIFQSCMSFFFFSE